MIDTENIEELMIDDWYKMNRHDWKYVCKEHKDLLAEVERLREEIRQRKILTNKLNNIIGTFDDFMCNNWTPANIHSLWNEILTKGEEK